MADSFPQRHPSPLAHAHTYAHTSTHTPVPLWMGRVIQVLASAEMATWPLLTQREPSWDERSRQNPPTVCPCVFLAAKTTGRAPGNMLTTGSCLTSCRFFIFRQQKKTRRKEKLKSTEFSSDQMLLVGKCFKGWKKQEAVYMGLIFLCQ